MLKTHDLDDCLARGIEDTNKRLKAYEEILEELNRLCNEQSMKASGEQVSDVVYVDDVVSIIKQFQAEQKVGDE